MAKHDRDRIKAADRMEPLDHQRQHREIVDGETMRAGEVVRVVQPPLDRYQKRKVITPRQHTAGARLADDYQLGVLGARDPEARGGARNAGGLTEAQLIAATAYRKAVQALGPRLSAIVLAVCCEEMSAEKLAELRLQDPRQVLGVLKIGLDHLGDHYGEPSEVVEEVVKVEQVTVLVRGKPTPSERRIVMTYRHEADGTVRAVQLGKRLWDQVARNAGDLRRIARTLAG